MIWRGEKVNLTACCKRIGYKLIGAHGAMADVYATVELFKYQINLLRNLNNAGNIISSNKPSEKTRDFWQI